MFHGHLIGLYEKALSKDLSWQERLGTAAGLGFDYVEISIDETDGRLSRLDWDIQRKREFVKTVGNSGIGVRSMCLSAHRRFPFGSADQSVRQRAAEIMRKAVEFADSTGIRTIQMAGYDVYYEPSTPESVGRFEKGLEYAASLAEKYQIMLGMEIMDTPFMNSISKHLVYEQKINSPYFKVYPDIGNLTAWGNDIRSEIAKGSGSIVAFHLKETKPVTPTEKGEFRNVRFGDGSVDFRGFFRIADEIGYTGPFTVEMWTGTTDDDIKEIKRTLEYLENEYGGQ